MAIDVSAVAARVQTSSFPATSESGDFDRRWAAWQAKGAEHDRAVRRKMTIVGPVLLIVIAVVMYSLLGR